MTAHNDVSFTAVLAGLVDVKVFTYSKNWCRVLATSYLSSLMSMRCSFLPIYISIIKFTTTYRGFVMMGRNGKWRLRIQSFNCPEPHLTIGWSSVPVSRGSLHRRRPSCPWGRQELQWICQCLLNLQLKFFLNLAPACSNLHHEKAPVHTPIARAWTWWTTRISAG